MCVWRSMPCSQLVCVTESTSAAGLTPDPRRVTTFPQRESPFFARTAAATAPRRGDRASVRALRITSVPGRRERFASRPPRWRRAGLDHASTRADAPWCSNPSHSQAIRSVRPREVEPESPDGILTFGRRQRARRMRRASLTSSRDSIAARLGVCAATQPSKPASTRSTAATASPRTPASRRRESWSAPSAGPARTHASSDSSSRSAAQSMIVRVAEVHRMPSTTHQVTATAGVTGRASSRPGSSPDLRGDG